MGDTCKDIVALFYRVIYYILYCGGVIEINNSVAKHSKCTTKEVKNLLNIARKTGNNLVMIAYN